MRDAATGHVDWNPHVFNYPSLSIYLHFAVQQLVWIAGRISGRFTSYADYLLAFSIDPTVSVLGARLVGIGCELFAILGLMRIGDRLVPRAGWLAGALVAFTPLCLVTSTSVFADSVMAAAAIAAVDRLLNWSQTGRPATPIWGAIWIGLAAGAKYPAGALVVMLSWIVLSKRGAAGLGPLAGLIAVAVAAFVFTTPFAVLDSHAFLRDFAFESRHAAQGHLGSFGHQSFGYHLTNLWRQLGPLALAGLVLSPALLLMRPALRTSVVALWCALIGFAAPISLARIDAERYLLPVVYLGAVLGAATVVTLATKGRRVPARLVVALVAICFLTPSIVGGVALLRRSGRTTQAEATSWCASHLPREALLVQEGYSARLPTVLQMSRLRDASTYQSASAGWKQRFDAIRAFHAVSIPLSVSGAVSIAGGGGRAPIILLTDAGELNRVFYEPEWFRGIDFFMTSGAVRGRFEADPKRYEPESNFYRRLTARGRRVASFAPGPSADGPLIEVFAIDSSLAPGGDDHPYWWADVIPDSLRGALARIEDAITSETACDSSTFGAPAPGWVRGARELFRTRIAPFYFGLATEQATLGRDSCALALTRALSASDPADVPTILLHGSVAARLGRWSEVRAVCECPVRFGLERADPLVVFLYAQALVHTGEGSGGEAALRSLLIRTDAPEELKQEAANRLAHLDGSTAGKPR